VRLQAEQALAALVRLFRGGPREVDAMAYVTCQIDRARRSERARCLIAHGGSSYWPYFTLNFYGPYLADQFA
jgi:hypothetical protein